jgi:hypothetical protein
MAHEVSKLDRTDASNIVLADGGWPEGMARSVVNNQARQNLGGLRRWYQDPEWTQLLEETAGPTYTITKDSDTQINVASSPATDATEHFVVGTRIRISVDGSSAVEGYVVSAVFSTPDTTVVVSFKDASVVPAGANRAELYFAHTARDAAFRDTGTSAGKIPLYDDLGTAAFKGEGAASTLDADTVDGEEAQDLVDRTLYSRNVLYNPDFAIDQRGGHEAADITGLNANADSDYQWDRWQLWSDGNDRFKAYTSSAGNGPSGVANLYGALTGGGAISAPPASEQGGISQWLEYSETFDFTGGDAIFSVYLSKIGTYGGAVGIALIRNTGTPDSPNAVVTAWNGAGVLPTLGASVSIIDSAFVTAPAYTTWTRFSVSGAVSVGDNNLGVLIWVDSNDFVATDDLLFAGAMLTKGSALTPFVPPSPAEELARCMRYFQRSDELEAGKLQQNGGTLASTLRSHNGVYQWRLQVDMRASPTVTPISPGAATENWSPSANVPTVSASSKAVYLSNGNADADVISAAAEAEL